MFLRKSPTPLSKKVLTAMVAMVAALAPTLAFADEVEYLTQSNGNILWTLVAAFLVMIMQAGFGCVECGFTRAKSAGNIMMKNFLDFSVGSVCFFLFGFAIMFGLDSGGFFGTSGFSLSGVADADLPWTYTFWFFQSVFAATAATIVSGGMAERTKFSSYILVSIVVTGLIYPLSGHWAWGSLWLGDDGAGWLEGLGFCDFAGSSVVHSVGGWIALAGALVLGPRVGKYTEDGKAKAIPGHNIPLAALGVFILWFGWFGFNPGSTTTADDTIGLIAMNTSLAACAGVLGSMAIAWFRFGKPDISMTFNGALAGLVGITAPCATVTPGSSIVIGLVAGVLVVLAIEFIDKVLKIDDPVGASSVHGVCGAWGTIACGLFNTDGGLFFGGGFAQLGVQLIGVGVFFVWAFGAGFILMSAIKAIFGLRVTKEEELKGLDIAEHGCESYNGFQLFSNEQQHQQHYKENKKMKLIIAYIRPEKLNDVKQALYAKEIYSLSVTNILGSGRQKGFTETYRGVQMEVNLLKKVRLEIGVNDDFEAKALEAILAAGQTGNEGDGVIFVSELNKALRIRTGEDGIL